MQEKVNNRYLVIRLDIDTPLCLKIGVPKLIQLAKNQGVHFTFFANMGRSISRIEALKNIGFDRQGSFPEIKKLSNVQKLGWHGYLSIAVMNQQVGLSFTEELNSLVSSGHEVGLHGGENHALWQKYAHNFSRQQLDKQIKWGIDSFHAVTGVIPSIFSSPGWNSPNSLGELLTHHHFIAMADTYSNSEECVTEKNGIKNINTNLAGRPGGVGYFEYCKSSGLNNLNIIEKIKAELNSRKINVIYDHPYYLANNHYSNLEQIIDYAKKSNINIVTMGQLLKNHE